MTYPTIAVKVEPPLFEGPGELDEAEVKLTVTNADGSRWTGHTSLGAEPDDEQFADALVRLACGMAAHRGRPLLVAVWDRMRQEVQG